MISQSKQLFYGTLLLLLPSMLSATLTTLQHWDPMPFYNAANIGMPPDTQFCYGIKQRLINNDSGGKRRRFGINFSPFVQKATKAQQTEDIYYGDVETIDINGAAPRTYMSNYQGTPSLMGLFLGQDINGNSIWGGPTDYDNGDTTKITEANIDALYYLPGNIQNAIKALNNTENPDITTSTALIYNKYTENQVAPSIFSESVLDKDEVYFGAFAVPLSYQKAGFRWEVNLDISDSIGFLVRSGFVQITQRTLEARELSSKAIELTSESSIYSALNTVGKNEDTAILTTNAQAQALFNQWITYNLNDLLDPEDGADYDLTSFSQAGIEDIQMLMFMRHSFVMHPADPDKFASLILTPYAQGGWTFAVSDVKNYSKLYALPFGNNGHTSVGGVVGLNFDFLDSIEMGFEFGATAFLSKEIYMPCPNHELQRVIYPYRTWLKVSPGFNSHFSAVFNAAEFAHNTSFSFKYTYLQHTRDTIEQVNYVPYFFTHKLEDLSPWRSQMFIASLDFKIQPSIYLSLGWQGALSQRNAYCSHTILGTLSFLF